jgi:hypothetical protein
MAKADQPRTWGLRSAAEVRAKMLPKPHKTGGVGIQLGDLGDGRAIGGVDLDSCRSDDGAFSPWATKVMARFPTYCEVSPSGGGCKLFFIYATADLPALRAEMGDATHSKLWQRTAGHDGAHPPAIELHLSNRYFAWTGERVDGAPEELRPIDRDTLLWLLKTGGPAFVTKEPAAQPELPDNQPEDSGDLTARIEKRAGRYPTLARRWAGDWTGLSNTTRSAKAMSLGAVLKLAGFNRADVAAALLLHPDTREWAAEVNERDLGRIFDRAGSKARPSYGSNADANPNTSAHGSNTGTVIRVVNGELEEAVTAGEAALISARLGVYQRSTFIVMPGTVRVTVATGRKVAAQRILVLGESGLLEAMTSAAKWEVYDGRSEEWVRKDCPTRVVKALRDRTGRWKLPVLAGIINAPTLRADGTLLNRPGYDEATGLLFDPAGATFPAIPENPTKADAEAALAVLCEPVATFPFVGDADRAVALSALLTASIRLAIPTAPMHCFTAPVAGSGKSMLVDLCSVLVTGREAAVIAQGKTPEETEKRLGSLLLAGDPVIAIDNVEEPLGGEFLCQVLTQTVVKARILGKSQTPDLPSNAFVTATGNNLVLVGDVTRRALVCQLDPKCERPEQRKFDRDPIEMVRADRGRHLAAALTVLRAYHNACRACPRPAARDALGSFAAWSQWVREALIWLGEADPVATMEVARESDPKLAATVAVVSQWREVIGAAEVTVKALIERATACTIDPWGKPSFHHPDFREALLVVAGAGGAVNSERLGKWLRLHKDRVVAGGRIVKSGETHGTTRWQLLSEIKA